MAGAAARGKAVGVCGEVLPDPAMAPMMDVSAAAVPADTVELKMDPNAPVILDQIESVVGVVEAGRSGPNVEPVSAGTGTSSRKPESFGGITRSVFGGGLSLM